MQKVIFLDVDGVLNSLPYSERMADSKNAELNPENIENLAKIQHSTNADIILCSTWKQCDTPDIPECYEIYTMLTNSLAKHNMTIKDKTTDVNGHRPTEIKSWLDKHPDVTHYVILDDDYTPDDYKTVSLDKHLVQTKYFCLKESEGGIQPEHIIKAIDILNNTPQTS